LEHAENPVDWYPWGPEAWGAARALDRPIFLSIGYSACHWCHVMARESFEDPEIARLLSESFVAIKVDREEHPELDQLYMEAVQMLVGQGGWPLSVFLTPGLEPFFGGTYWPPRARGGMPSFGQVLRAVAGAWEARRGEVVEHARKLTELLSRSAAAAGSGGDMERAGSALLEGAATSLARAFDRQYGGFGPAPKFPHPAGLCLLIRRWHRTGEASCLEMAELTLRKMAAGGMYDHLGGGFHRYSTDARWLVPHFEKMLYDNALLAGAYLEAFQATGHEEYAEVVRHSLDYLLADMIHPDGGFCSSEDADSEGHEGRFYLWTLDEVRAVLGREVADVFAYVYDVTGPGNFEHGQNVLNRAKTLPQCAAMLHRDVEFLRADLDGARQQLLAARSKRVRPRRDDKVLVGWNGLAIEAMARAGAVLGEPRYAQAAARAAQFVLDNLRGPDGRLLHCWRAGRPSVYALLDDYAALAAALLALYQARGEERWIDEAVRLAEELLARFVDPVDGGFYLAAADHPSLIVRQKDVLDRSTPSGGGLAAGVLLRLGRLCARDEFLVAAERALRAAVPWMEQYPLASGQMLLALDAYLHPAPEVVVLGSDDRAGAAEVLGRVHRRYQPNQLVAFRDLTRLNGYRSPTLVGLFRDKAPVGPGPTLYLCDHFGCQTPVSGTQAALAVLAARECRSGG
jgi:uncharacterized protein YyaL (SSP411 family)